MLPLLQTYAKEEGPYKAKAKKIYDELRRNVVDNVFNEYQRTGYVWEQYDPSTGEGKRRSVEQYLLHCFCHLIHIVYSHPFTGWTSLVTLSKSIYCFSVPCMDTNY